MWQKSNEIRNTVHEPKKFLSIWQLGYLLSELKRSGVFEVSYEKFLWRTFSIQNTSVQMPQDDGNINLENEGKYTKLELLRCEIVDWTERVASVRAGLARTWLSPYENAYHTGFYANDFFV